MFMLMELENAHKMSSPRKESTFLYIYRMLLLLFLLFYFCMNSFFVTFNICYQASES